MKRLYYYLLPMALISAASMADIGAHTTTKTSKKIGKRIPKKEQQAAEKKTKPLHVSLSQDIKNHPFLWAGSACIAILAFWVPMLSYFILFKFFKQEILAIKLKKWLKWPNKYNFWNHNPNNTKKYSIKDDLKVIQEVTQYLQENNWTSELYNTLFSTFFKYLFIEIVLYLILSVLIASKKSLWVNKDKKDDAAPPFTARLWRSFRFTFPLGLLFLVSHGIALLIFDGEPVKRTYKGRASYITVGLTPFIAALAAYLSIKPYPWVSTASCKKISRSKAKKSNPNSAKRRTVIITGEQLLGEKS